MKKSLWMFLAVLICRQGLCIDKPDREFSLGLVLSRFENPVINSHSRNYVLPTANFIYYGEKFFIDEEIGYTLKNFDNAVINIVGSFNLDFIYFVPHNASLDKLRNRHLSFMAGIEALYFTRSGEIQLQALQDISNTQNGQQLVFNYRFPLRVRQWNIVPQIGLHWKSKKLIQYYYGIEAEDAGSFPLYDAQSGINTYAALDAEYAINYHWLLGGFVHYTKLASTIEKSPIIEKNRALTLAIGVKYVF